MAEKGINCLYFDGVIRPRPALTPEAFGTDDAQPWQLIYEDGDEPGYHMTAYCQMDDGTILASFIDTAGTGQVLYYSTDMGQSWQSTAHHPRAVVTNTYTVEMKIFAGYLFMFDLFWNHTKLGSPPELGACQPDPNAHVPTEYIYRAAVNLFPTTLTFTTLGPVEWNAYDIDPVSWPADPYYATVWRPGGDIFYDAATGHLVAADQRGVAGSIPLQWGLKDALTTADWAADSYYIAGSPIGVAISGSSATQPNFVNKEWIVWGTTVTLFGSPYFITTSHIEIVSCVYNSSSGEYEYGDDSVGFQLFSGQYAPDGFSEWTINYGPHKEAESYSIVTQGVGLNDTAQSEFLITFRASIDGGARAAHDVWRFRISGGTDGAPYLIGGDLLYTFDDVDLQINDWNMHNVADRIAFFFETRTNNLMRGASSDDDGITWAITAEGGPPGSTGSSIIDRQFEYNENTLQHFVAIHTAAATNPYTHLEWAREEIWVAPTTGGPGQYGDSTTIYQMDMDDEDSVVVQGTTKALLRLDRANAEWDRITADHAQTSGADPWNQNNTDVPPLSVSDDRAEYESGTTIDGTYGTHPWVFRSFEAQGQTFLLGTNGQCRPICYHPDMVGGFARRMGEVPPDDPNDVNPWDPLSWPVGYLQAGNLAPVARCMAVGANRVMLANLPATSPYAVEVSGFNDPDRGWGFEQFSLLGDTPGEIVSLNEISALSVAMYKTDAIYQAIAQTEFLGVAAPFRFELSKAGISGPCSPNSVLRNYDGKHIYVARDGGVYMYDGVAPIDGGRNIRRMIQGDLDLDSLGKTWGMVDTDRKLVWFFYPSKSGLVNKGLVLSTDQGYPWPVWPVSLPQGWDFAAGGAVFLEDDITIGDIGRLGDYTTETLGSFSAGAQQLLMGTRGNAWFSQKWEDDGDYTDGNLPIPIDLLGGWVTPGGVHRWTADELYHLFSSPDPELELLITLYAQQFGEEILKSKDVPLTANRLRRRTRHRVSGTQFAVGMKGAIDRFFQWGGGILSAKRSGDR
jgi:hypothetical protein